MKRKSKLSFEERLETFVNSYYKWEKYVNRETFLENPVESYECYVQGQTPTDCTEIIAFTDFKQMTHLVEMGYEYCGSYKVMHGRCCQCGYVLVYADVCDGVPNLRSVYEHAKYTGPNLIRTSMYTEYCDVLRSELEQHLCPRGLSLSNVWDIGKLFIEWLVTPTCNDCVGATTLTSMLREARRLGRRHYKEIEDEQLKAKEMLQLEVKKEMLQEKETPKLRNLKKPKQPKQKTVA